MSIIAFLFPTVTAEYAIDISPLNIVSGQEISVTLKEIPQGSLINMTLNATVQTTPGQDINYTLNNFLFPYESGISSFVVEMFNLVPSTLATASVIREDGTEASKTGTVLDDGSYNASILHELNTAQYNVSFMGTTSSSNFKVNIDFGGRTVVLGGGSNVVKTTKSYFTPGGIPEGEVDIKVYVDKILQKTETLKISPGI